MCVTSQFKFFILFFCKMKTSPSFPRFFLEYPNWLVMVGIFGISLCSAEQDQTLRWCQWPISRSKSCLFALLLVLPLMRRCTDAAHICAFVFFRTWCKTRTFDGSKRQLSVRIQAAKMFCFGFLPHWVWVKYAHWCCWDQAAVEQCASWCGLCHICLACSCLKGLQACQFCCRGHFSNVTSHTL